MIKKNKVQKGLRVLLIWSNSHNTFFSDDYLEYIVIIVCMIISLYALVNICYIYTSWVTISIFGYQVYAS
jgi:hypothetical protein